MHAVAANNSNPQRFVLTALGLGCCLMLATLELAAAETKIDSAGAKSTIQLHRPLPESLTSFGACVVDEYLYVFSGHSGVAHGFGRDLLVNHFRRIKFDDPQAAWEELAMHKPSQSVALVTDGTYIYRVGGLSFLNSGDDAEDDFDSTDHFARYDIARNAWTDLAPLPEPRSSLDAAVLGRSIYVAGGWNLQGKSSRGAPWHDDILRFDLDNPSSGWQSIEGPGYLTRAVSTAAFDGKLYVFGGIQQRGITRNVSVYDPNGGSWSEAPELPADNAAAGFATSSFAAGNHLYVTGASGVLYRLSDDAQSWEIANRLMFPRMFLRLLPISDTRLIALGGTGSIGRTSAVESIDLSAAPKQNVISWSVKFGGRAKHSQNLVLDGASLYAMGGNASREPHDFSPDAFVNEAFAFDLGNQSVEPLPNLPEPMQSGAAFINAQTSQHRSIVIAGGMGPGSEQMQTLKSCFAFDPESKQWQDLPNTLPEPRAMFAGTRYDEAIWLFGGSRGHGQGLATSVFHWWGDTTDIAPLHAVSVPHPRRSFGAAALQDKYYMIGGLEDGNTICESVDVFHFDDRSWSSISSPNVPRVFPSLVQADGRLFLFGGFTNQTGHFAPATSLEVFDPKLGEWSTVFENLSGLTAKMTMLALDGRLLFYGIDDSEDGLANFVLFDPAPLTAPDTILADGFGGREQVDESAETAKMMIRKDANKDGMLSAEELGARMAGLISQGDTDGDGLLTLAETTKILKTQVDADKAEAEIKRPQPKPE